MDRQSSSFLCKKWTLFTFCAIGILSTVILDAMASKLVDSYVDNNFEPGQTHTQAYINELKSAAKTIIYVASVFTILFNLVGLMGAYKEHYCMTMTYAILMTLGALGSISAAVKTPAYWFSTVLDAVIVVIAFLFLQDLRRLRIQAFATPVFVSPPPAHQTIVHIPGSSYPSPPQPGLQYGTHQQPDSWQTPAPPPYILENKSA